MVKCPDCDSELEAVRNWNPEVLGTKNNPICNYVCRNPTCTGWFCDECGEYHPFGTSCSVALVHNVGLQWDKRGMELYRSSKSLKSCSDTRTPTPKVKTDG